MALSEVPPYPGEFPVSGNGGAALAEIRLRLVGAAEERRQHFLQSGDEVIGFPIAFQQGFDGLVLDADLSFEKFVLAFKALDVGCRDWWRTVSSCFLRGKEQT